MIIIKNRKLLIPEYERYIGTTADSNSEVLTFRIDRYTQTEMDLSAFTVKADIYRYETEETDRADLEMEVQDNYILLYLYITSGMVAYPGTILIDIKAFNDDGTVKWSSYKGAFYVEDPFTTPQATLENLTELEQLEARINRAIATANEKAIQAAENWLDENVHPETGYVIDRSLSIRNAAADAKATGDSVKAEAAARQTAINSEALTRKTADSNLLNALSAETTARVDNDSSLQSQINQYVTPSTQQPDEVVNARVGADGTTYPTLGDAIRGQVTDLNRTLTGYNSYDVLREFGTFANGVSGGITYTWDADHTVCTAVGTTNGLSICNLYAGGSIPSGMVPGGKYYVKVKTTDLNLLLEIIAHNGSTIVDDIFIFTEDAEYTVPNDATDLTIRLRTRHIDGSPSTVNDTISVAILNAKTNSDLTVKVMENTENIEENAERASEDRINITKYNSYDLLREFGTFTGRTSGGVAYTWNEDHTVCTAVGTTNALSICNLYAGSTLPDGMVPGGKYYVKVSTTDSNLLLEIIAYNGSTVVDDVYLTEDTVYTVPQTATRLTIRIRTRYTSTSPSTVNDTISVAILNAKSNADLTAEVEEIADRTAESLNFMQIFPKYTTIGDSLMGGFMNRDGVSVTTEVARAAGNNWVNYIALRTGRAFTNLAVGGSTAKQWRESLLTTANIDTNCYLIGIGVNDRRQGLTVGSITDIVSDFANNADSFYGNYDYMVRQLMAWKPTAHIFCFTIPSIEGGTSEDYNTAIRSIAALYPSKVHCIDLATEQAYSSSIITDNYSGGHFNPIAYNYMSGIIENAINAYMKNNNVIFATAPYA